MAHYSIYKSPQAVPILSWSYRVHDTPPPFHFLRIHFNIILHSTPRSSKSSPSLGPPPTKTLCAPLLYPVRATCFAHLILRLVTRMTFGEEFGSWSSPLFSRYPLFCHFVPLRPKCLPQHPIITHPQSVLLPECDRRSQTPTQNNRQHYSSLYKGKGTVHPRTVYEFPEGE